MDPTPETFPSASNRRFLLMTAGMAFLFGLMAFFYSHPDWTEPRLNRELFIWPVTLGLVLLYWKGYQALREHMPAPAVLVGMSILVSVAALWVPPFHSTDLFGYINRGWQQVAYAMNPYVYTVDDIPDWGSDPMITNHWVNNPSPYGFVYLQVARGLTWLGGGELARTMLLFKLFNLFLHLGVMALIWQAARRLLDRESALRGLYLYGFNPLILVHALSNGHNDLLMGALITASATAAVLGRNWVIIPALVAATLVKYAAVIILPLAGLLLIKQKAWGALIVGLLLGLAVFAGAGISYLPDWQHFAVDRIQRNAFVSHSSLHSVFFNAYEALGEYMFPALQAHEPAVRSFLKNLLLGGLAGFYAWLCWRILKSTTYSVPAWIRDSLVVMIVLVGIVSLKFYPWYLGMFMPLAFFLPEGHFLRRFVVIYSCFQMLALTFIGQTHFLNFLLMSAVPMIWVFRQARLRAAERDVPAGTVAADGAGS